MPVDIFGFESRLYAFLDSYGMNGETSLEGKRFPLGDDQYVDVTIRSLNNKPLTNKEVFNSNEINFSINWRKQIKGKEFQRWFAVDNYHNERMLHFHVEDEKHKFKDHQPMPFNGTVSELISDACDRARKLLREKYPELEIKDTDGFKGFSGNSF